MALELALTDTAKSVSIPLFFIAGINIEPKAEASAVADPEIPEKNILETIETWARPPLIWPTKFFENETILSVIPLSFMISPAAIKKGMANKVNESTPEYILVTIALKGKSPKKLSASIDEKPIANATGKLINKSKKKAENKIASIINLSKFY